MRCDRCGATISPGQAIETTKSEQIGSAHVWGARTRTVVIHVCPNCASNQGCVVQAGVLVFVLLGLLVILRWLL